MPRKKPTTSPRPPRQPKQVQNSTQASFLEGVDQVKNGLSDAIFGSMQTCGSQLSSTDTLFKNNRNYLISNNRQLLSEIYVEHGLVKTIVDVPVDDALRGGYEIKSKQLDAEQILELLRYIDRKDINNQVIGQAWKWNRLYGGAGDLVITDQMPNTPFDINLVNKKTPLDFRAVDMWELFYALQNTDEYNPATQSTSYRYFNYYGTQLDRSRVLVLKGITPPSFVRPRLRNWGLSVLETLVRSINQYLKSNDLVFEVLDEFKLDIFKIKNMTQTLLSSGGTEKIQRRIELANQQKNFLNSMAMDSEDDFIQKALSFAGIADMMKEFRIQIASDMRMPLTKLFGLSATGFNSGDDDIENYNAMIESEIRSKGKYHVVQILEIICKHLFDFVPSDLSIEFKSLRVLSAEQEENVKEKKFNRVMSAYDKGICSGKEAQDALNKDNLLPVQVEVVLDDEIAEQEDPDQTEEDDGEESEG